MGVLSFLGLQKRSDVSTLSNPQPWLVNLFGGTDPAINADSVYGIPAFWTGIRVIQETIASLPFEVFLHRGDGVYPATNRPEYTLLSLEPCESMSAYDFKSRVASNLEIYGNAYAKIYRNEAGIVERLEWIDPTRVQVLVRWIDNVTTEVKYKILPPPSVTNFKEEILDYDQILHFKIMSDGIMGRSMITACKEALGLMLTSQKYGYEFYKNGAMPSGIFSTPSNLTRDQKDLIIKDWSERNTGYGNSGKIVVLSNGAQYQHISSTPADAKWLESMHFTSVQIGQMLRIPQHLMGNLERATNNNIEQQTIDFIVHGIRPRIKGWENEYNRKLWLTPTNRNKYYVKANLNAMMRGDSLGRAEFYNKMMQIGVMNQDEIRGLEELNPIPGGHGKTYLVPLNMRPIDTPFEQTQNTQNNGNGNNNNTKQ